MLRGYNLKLLNKPRNIEINHFWDKKTINKDQPIDALYAETNRQWFKAITVKHIQGHKRKYAL